MAKFTDLTPINGSSLTDSFVFAVSTASDSRSIALDELQNSFSGLNAKNSSGFNVFGNTVASGITVGDNGFLGVDNTDPLFSLHVGDYGGATHPEFRISGTNSARNVSVTIADSGIYWQTIKKASDTDYYLQNSEDGVNFTGVLNIDKNGNFGLFDGSSNLDSKLYVSGDAKFLDGAGGFVFDSSESEIKTNTAGDIFYINKNNTDDVVLGNDILYVTNNSSSPTVGIGTNSPSNPLEIHGSNTILNLENSTSNRSRIRISNNVNTVFVTLQSNRLSFGPVSSSSTNNLIYDTSSKKLGLGTIDPANKLHIYDASDSRLVKFEGVNSSKSEIFQVHNYATNDFTGPRNTVYTFARSNVDPSGPTTTTDISKWSIGLYDDGVANNYEDVFVFRVNGDTSSESSIKAYLDTAGNLDIDGSYSSEGSYAKGKFVQVYDTRVTGTHQYFNPFSASSNSNPSGVSGSNLPFGVAAFSGKIENIKIFSTDESVTGVSNDGGRFEISSVTPSSGVNGFVSGFSVSPTSAATSLPVSGIIGQFSVANISGNMNVYSYDSSTISGSTNFDQNDLIQYRIVQNDGTRSTGEYNVISTISYTIT